MFSMASRNPSSPSPAPLPRHIAIIMDGNGRWAKARHLPRTAGHKKGADAVHNAIDACMTLGVEYLTLYAFSSENWKRSASEVTDLMELLRFYLGRELNQLHKNNIRIRIIGERSRLAPDILESLHHAETLTQHNTALHLTIALSYGSRQELVQSIRSLAEQLAAGNITTADITEECVTQALYTHDLPDPDLLIRTGGEQRLSNFLLWQSAYTEFYFTETLWPDFDHEHLKRAIEAFQSRERRFGAA